MTTAPPGLVAAGEGGVRANPQAAASKAVLALPVNRAEDAVPLRVTGASGFYTHGPPQTAGRPSQGPHLHQAVRSFAAPRTSARLPQRPDQLQRPAGASAPSPPSYSSQAIGAGRRPTSAVLAVVEAIFPGAYSNSTAARWDVHITAASGRHRILLSHFIILLSFSTCHVSLPIYWTCCILADTAKKPVDKIRWPG